MAFQEDEFFGSLYKDNYDLLIKISFRLTGDIELAQDLTQETFALALFNMRKLRGHENPAGWLVITLRNMINNERRRSTFRRHISLEELPIEPGTYDDISIEELLPGNCRMRTRRYCGCGLRNAWIIRRSPRCSG